MLPKDRLGKKRLPVCPRAQIADVLEPLAATTARRTRVGTDAEASKGGAVEREHAPLYTGQVPGSTLVAEM
jgi:hypothetical protein